MTTSAERPSAPHSLRQLPFLGGLAAVTAAVLALEVLITRVLSVVTWYSLAFLVIAMGLFGLTAGSLRVYFDGERYSGDALAPALARACRWLAVAIPASYVALLIIPLRVTGSWTTIPLFLAFSAAIALPFYPAGVVITGALTRAPLPVGRVYAVDLLGAALGAPAVPILLRATDAGTAVLVVACVAAAASIAFERSSVQRGSARRSGILLAGLALLSLGNASVRDGLVPLWAKGLPESREHLEVELWNSHSRVQVFRETEAPAALWGEGSKCKNRTLHQRTIVIDAHALTPLYHADGGLESLSFLKCDVTNAVHAIRPKGPIAIVGVGGSRDVQYALLIGHRPVVGIEFNDRLLQLIKSPMGEPTRIRDRDDVELVHAEARSYLASTERRFRVIQASLIDTWAATGAGAHALGENGLYTVEAWKLFLDRLEPGGVFTVSRWSNVETARLLSMAVAALLEHGAEDPRKHIAMLSGGKVTTLLLARDPLSGADESALRKLADEQGFQLLASPSLPPRGPQMAAVLSARSRVELDRVTLKPLLDFRPATDDRPFFFNVVRLRAAFVPLPAGAMGMIEGNVLATRTLGLAFGAAWVFVLVAVVWPLWRRARPKHRTDARLWAGLVYFTLLGVGFMLAEIALLQRLSLVLGHPSYSLMVVLATLVGSAGLGSLASDKLPIDRAPLCYALPVLMGGTLVLVALLWHPLADALAPRSTSVRIAGAAGVTALVGIVLGFGFPTGMRLARAGDHDDETPWFWGMNGVGSVLASSTAVLIALAFGLTVLTVVAALCYFALVPAVFVLQRRGSLQQPSGG